MASNSESEIILNPDGSVYHLNLLPANIADTIIAVGDPSRVFQITEHFDKIDFEIIETPPRKRKSKAKDDGKPKALPDDSPKPILIK